MQDLRATLLCARGARAWFRAQGLSWHRFRDEGLPVEELEATGDAQALKVAAAARARAARDG